MFENTASPLTKKIHYDIIIAGGGMVGVSLACALATADSENKLSILLVDNFPIKRLAAGDQPKGPVYHPSFDARSTALSLASIEIYESIGVLPDLLKHAAAIREIHVSDRGHIGNALLDAKEQKKDSFGYVIENQWLGAVLLDRLMAVPSIELLSGASVSNIIPKQAGVSVDVTALNAEQQAAGQAVPGPAVVSASLLVVADGAQSGLRKSLGISASVTRYDQCAVIANVQTQLPHNGQAFERFTSDGAVAFLPLPDLPDSKNRSALVWTIPSESQYEAMSDGRDKLDDEEFIAELQKAFGYRLGRIQRVGKRQSYPLSLTVADEVVRSHIVLMGNSAHSLHPVAGQGFNLALRDVAALAERIANASQKKNDIGSLVLLEDYAAAQIKDQNLTVGFSHHLIELFGQQALPVQLGRSLGLLALDLLRPAKKRFSDQAAGLNSRRSLR